ncbi:two-component, sensor histidine protein kinase [Alcanivorax nanhaiticus]|uniref:histidine kinase n=1 Tax=Alcanivorax nanhaiticus TaxID=1177154 RepID=A0A095SIH0_9GAMM|nr:ATP-binding protein [Alcanivorax nanhaiticus]KGD64456.1 two-component, sensor histidine protein kinase [Alcanivorax nanhaiticus]
MSTTDSASRHPLSALRNALSSGSDDATGRKNLQLLIQLRWLAMFGQFATILVVHFGLNVPLPVSNMLIVLFGLLLFNALSVLRLRARRPIGNTELFFSLLVDVGTLTILLFMSGGASNPFVFLFLLQVILGAVLLEAWSTWVILVVTTLCFGWLAWYGHPLPMPLDHSKGLFSLYIEGMLICFVLNGGLLVIFINRINRNKRQRDERLAELRQRAVEEEHIVRMGLLASGAAHELGTPLATLSVILGDWKHMAPFKNDPDMAQEIAEMQTQVLRCKSIVSGILLSAGETRGEASEETTVREFLDELVEEWRDTRSVKDFIYMNDFGTDLRIVSDDALKQSIHNVLDNALEASPNWVRLDVHREDETLLVSVTDRGPGFPEEMLDSIGRPYQSTKGRPGSGLGLFLVMNVLRTLGGNLRARNLVQGGALVTLSLPLNTVTLEEEG